MSARCRWARAHGWLGAIALVLVSTGSACGGGGGDDDAVRIGLLLTLSGPSGAVGETYRAGADYWEATVGESGFLGRPVEVVVRDDGGTPDQATRMTRELLDQEDVDVVVGPFGAGAAGGAIPLVADAGKLHVLMSAYPEARDATRYPLVFPTEVSQEQTADDIVAQARRLGYERIAYAAPNDAFGQGVLDNLEAAVEDDDQVELVAAEFYEAGANDVTSQMRTLRDSDADVLVLQDVGAAGYVTGVQTTERLGWDVPIFGNAAMAEPAIAEAVGARTAERLFVLGQTRSSLRPYPDDVAGFLEGFTDHIGAAELEYRVASPMTVFDSLEMVRVAADEVGSLEADAIAGELEENGYDGLKAVYSYGDDEHLGVQTDELFPARVGTFRDGGLEAAS
jgi:branched-chain amino acid transport system substrate-binding protein